MSILNLMLIPLLLFISPIFSSNPDDFVQCLQKQCGQSSNYLNITNAIFTPDNSLFTTALNNYTRNLRYTTPSTPKPVTILKANHVSHVQAAIKCCKKVGLQMRIRSGGHDYDGLSYVSQVPFMILDTSNMRKIEINVANETATAQAGASLGELYYGIAEKSNNALAFPAGVCNTLGLGGHISGGGYGNMMRKYGLSVDNVIDAQIVDANGKILDRKSMGEDLFWAIRGGGGASFGVILSWTLKLVKVPQIVTVFKVPRNVEKGATDLVYKWEQIADKIDEDLFIRVLVDPVNSTAEPGKKTVNATFVGMFLGDSGNLLTLMKKSFPELGLQKNDCKEMKWVNSTLYWIGFPDGTPIEALLDKLPMWPTSFLTRKSDYVKKPIPKEGLEAIWKVVISQEVAMQWNPYGGKMAQIPPTETPFPHRAGNLFLVQYTANWKDGNLTEKYLKKVRTLFKAMTPYVSKNPREAFMNYRDIDIGSIGSNGNGTFKEASVYGTKIFKDNFERLVRVKTAVDPDDFFRYEQSIPTQTKGKQ